MAKLKNAQLGLKKSPSFVDLSDKDKDYELYGDDFEESHSLSSGCSVSDFFLDMSTNFDYLLPDGSKMIRDRDSESLIIFQPDGVVLSLYNDDCYYKQELVGMIQRKDFASIAVIVGKLIINNGDIDEKNDYDLSPFSALSEHIPSSYEMVTVSFDTIAHLFNISTPDGNQILKSHLVASLFRDGALSIVDFRGDETEKMSESQIEAMRSYQVIERNIQKRRDDEKEIPYEKIVEMNQLSKLFAAPAGFTIIGESYHRPATCIIFNKKTQETGLIGMDEDSYFGSILPYKVKTVAKAYELLTPKEAKGKKFIRQGEWFFIPVVMKEQTRLSKKAENPVGVLIPYFVTLPLERIDSNPHVINVSQTFDCFDCSTIQTLGDDGSQEDNERIRRQLNHLNIITEPKKNTDLDIDIYVRDFSCHHVDHEEVSDNSGMWHKVVCNTAVRSVSSVRMVD